MTRPVLLAAPDKFRGTATARELADALGNAAREAGWTARALPISDGGEGLLDCFGGANRVTTVTGPTGRPVQAAWRQDGTRAVIAMAEASGLALVAGANDAVAATSRGSGELILAAIEAGARDVIVGVGGSASTDGGLDAVRALAPHAPLDGTRGVRIVVAADVSTRFVYAAEVFAPQKGATAAQVDALRRRLDELATTYQDDFGVDVRTIDGSGAAGGFAGGLAALKASIRPGFDVVAEHTRLRDQLIRADLVVTGEGRLDSTSALGKAPVRVAALAAEAGVPCLLIAGDVAADVRGRDVAAGAQVISLTELFGPDAARADTLRCAAVALTAALRQRRS